MNETKLNLLLLDLEKGTRVASKHPLVDIHSAFVRKKNEGSALEFIPGYNFSQHPFDITQEMIDSTYNHMLALDKPFIKAKAEIISDIIAQIAALDFKHFVEDLVDQMFNSTDHVIQFLLTLVSRIILDPTTGFLRNAPRSQKNRQMPDPKAHLDFFSPDSADLQSQFGITLTQFRYKVYLKILDALEDSKKNIIADADFTIFVSSFLVSVQTSIVPPSFRMHDIACGYPARVEVLLATSQFMDQNVYTKYKECRNTVSPLSTQWTKILTKVGMDPIIIPETMKFAEPHDCSDNICMRFIKLLVFVNAGYGKVELPPLDTVLFKLLLGNDPDLASFTVAWIQTVLFLYPDYTFFICDEIENFSQISNEINFHQIHTLFHAITRIVDVLSVIPTRYIDDHQFNNLTAFSLSGLCSSHTRTRCTAYKLVQALSRFETGSNCMQLSVFFESNKSYFSHSMIHFLENRPVTIINEGLEKLRQKHLIPLPFTEAMISTNEILWQIMVSIVASLAVAQFPDDLIVLFKQYASNISDEDKVSQSHLLTFLAAFAESPITMFPVSQEDISKTAELTQMILNGILHRLSGIKTEEVAQNRIMLTPLNVSSFPIFIDLLSNNYEPRKVALSLRQISWNNNFEAVSEHSEFFNKFLTLFLRVYNEVKDHEISKKAISKFTDEHKKYILKNKDLLGDILVTLHKILTIQYQHHTTKCKAPFPCRNFILNTNTPDLQKTYPMHMLCFNLARCDVDDNLKSFALHALKEWFSCHKFSSNSLVTNEEFVNQVLELSLQLPQCLTNLLCYHFEFLYEKYLHMSLLPGGDPYFKAIIDFFRAPSLAFENNPIDIINTQWSSCSNTTKEGSFFMKYLQIIYENCGTLLLCCLFFINRPENSLTDEAFVTLASLTPVLSVFHMDGRDDHLKALITFFIDMCKQYGQSFGCFDMQSVYSISCRLCESFQFCLEQLLNDAFDSFPKHPAQIIDRMLFIITPWFDAVQFDTENRVISKETDLLFMRFSCYSFVEKLMTSFSHTTNDDINSSLFNVWRTLAAYNGMPGSNFLSIVLSLIYAAQNSSHHSVVYIIMRYIYRIAPQTIVDVLSSYLSFESTMFNSLQDLLSLKEQAENDFIRDLDESEVEDEDGTMVSMNSFSHINIESKVCNSGKYFILQTLSNLALDNVRPIIPSLPVIFAYCLVYLDVYFSLIQPLMMHILKKLIPLVENEIVPYLHEAINAFGSLNNAYESYDTTTTASILKCEKKLNNSIPDTNRTFLTRIITNFLLGYRPEMAADLGSQLLKWCLCYGDLTRACFALICYRGNLSNATPLLVGLASRAMWSVDNAIHYIDSLNVHIDESPYTYYIGEQLLTMRSLAEVFTNNDMLGSDSALFWMAVDCLKTKNPIFDNALELLEYILCFPGLFGYLSGRTEYSSGQFTPSIFWKLHQPWGDTFNGCARYIFEFDGVPNINLMIRVINLIVQTQYPILFSDHPNWMYVALLSLMPWFWSVVITDMSRFIYDSEAVQLMEGTLVAIEPFFTEPEIIEGLKDIMKYDDIDIFSTMFKFCEIIIPNIETSSLIGVCQFFKQCLKYGRSSMKMPLYSITAQIINFADDKLQVAASLSEFTEIVLSDKQSSQTYTDLYLEAIRNIDNIPEPPVNERTLGLPVLEMFERIVAVNIPHMYELNFTESISQLFTDLNSFPTMLPFEQLLLKNDKFKLVYESMKQSRIEPYESWTELLSKLHTSLIDVDDLDVMKKSEMLSDFPMRNIIQNALDQLAMKGKSFIHLETYENVMEEEEDIPEMKTDPYAFIFLEPEMFLPQVDDVNIIGNEYFEDQLGF